MSDINARALREFETTQLDLSDCSRLEIVVALHEHEKAGQRPETWPPKILADLHRFAGDWHQQHPDVRVRGQTYGLAKDRKGQMFCVLVIHHEHFNEASK